jgi:hypothetical protein
MEWVSGEAESWEQVGEGEKEQKSVCMKEGCDEV